MDNSLRLLNDAFVAGIIDQTKAALVEFSFEESAKALLILARLYFEDTGQKEEETNINKMIKDSFSDHKVKIAAVKTYYHAIFDNLDHFALESANIQQAMVLINVLMQDSGEEDREYSNELFIRSVAKENRDELKSDILHIFKPIFSMSDKVIEKVKKSGLYVNTSRKKKELIFPPKQDAHLITLMTLLICITGMLVYNWGGIDPVDSHAFRTFLKILSTYD